MLGDLSHRKTHWVIKNHNGGVDMWKAKLVNYSESDIENGYIMRSWEPLITALRFNYTGILKKEMKLEKKSTMKVDNS